MTVGVATVGKATGQVNGSHFLTIGLVLLLSPISSYADPLLDAAARGDDKKVIALLE